jgi:hypothetical protein
MGVARAYVPSRARHASGSPLTSIAAFAIRTACGHASSAAFTCLTAAARRPRATRAAACRWAFAPGSANVKGPFSARIGDAASARAATRYGPGAAWFCAALCQTAARGTARASRVGASYGGLAGITACAVACSGSVTSGGDRAATSQRERTRSAALGPLTTHGIARARPRERCATYSRHTPFTCKATNPQSPSSAMARSTGATGESSRWTHAAYATTGCVAASAADHDGADRDRANRIRDGAAPTLHGLTPYPATMLPGSLVPLLYF